MFQAMTRPRSFGLALAASTMLLVVGCKLSSDQASSTHPSEDAGDVRRPAEEDAATRVASGTDHDAGTTTDEQSCRDGVEGCGCYGNQTCNAGLVCLSHLCVSLGSGSMTTTTPASSDERGEVDAAVSLEATATTDVGEPSTQPTAQPSSSESFATSTALTVPASSSSGVDSGVSACGASCANSDLIDDFEDEDIAACSRDGWDSGWWLATDGLGALSAPLNGDRQGLLTQLAPVRDGSCVGLHLQGSGFGSWGVNLGLTLNNPDDTVPRPVDLSAAAGISFWLRGSGNIRVLVSTSDTDPPENGGTCASSCKQYFTGASYIAIPNAWTKVTIPFTSLYSATVGRNMSASDLSKVLFIAFGTETGPAFDVWLDDVSLSH